MRGAVSGAEHFQPDCFIINHVVFIGGTQHLFDAPGDPRVHYVRYEQNRGACYARNLGAQRAHGSILAFQDSDDLWHPDKLQKQYDLLTATGADLCYCGMNRVAAEKAVLDVMAL